MHQSQAYFNGQWVEDRELRLSVDDLGVALGAAVAERMRTVGGEVFRLDQHLQRLKRSLEIVGWDAPRIVSEVGNAVRQLIERNKSRMVPRDDWAVSVFVTPGLSFDAADPTICVRGFPLPFSRWAHQFEQGVDAVLSVVRQIPASCWPPELKCRSRMHYYLADRDAERQIPGARPILLDQEGYVTESSTANLILVDDRQRLVAPQVHEVLPGVSQQMAFELADAIGLERRHERITPDQLLTSSELLLTSTSVSILPIVRVDGQSVGDGRPGSIYRNLLAAWSEAVGLDLAAQAQQFALR
jgi:branched-subunit amino acid aminotransferase/4-amino-4-deoxychorismate lyase